MTHPLHGRYRYISVTQVRDNVGNTRVMEAACFLLGNVASSAEGLERIAANDGATLALKIVRQHDQDTGLFV